MPMARCMLAMNHTATTPPPHRHHTATTPPPHRHHTATTPTATRRTLFGRCRCQAASTWPTRGRETTTRSAISAPTSRRVTRRERTPPTMAGRPASRRAVRARLAQSRASRSVRERRSPSRAYACAHAASLTPRGCASVVVPPWVLLRYIRARGRGPMGGGASAEPGGQPRPIGHRALAARVGTELVGARRRLLHAAHARPRAPAPPHHARPVGVALADGLRGATHSARQAADLGHVCGGLAPLAPLEERARLVVWRRRCRAERSVAEGSNAHEAEHALIAADRAIPMGPHPTPHGTPPC
jgi:hypothetical protein